MCIPPKRSNGNDGAPLLMVSAQSYVGKDGGKPSDRALVVTGTAAFALLLFMEMALRFLFFCVKDLHPVLQDATGRHILSRHIGVDSFSCFVASYLGVRARHLMRPIYDAVVLKKESMPLAAFDKRMFTYHPEVMRMCLFFFSYQIKNFYDTIVWNDGPEFVMHHILCLFTCWGAMYQGGAHFYAPFYFGFSEVSTAVLCLLANFDDVHGVAGLAEAWPTGKVVLGAVFAVLFVICRVFLWTAISYYYCRDAWQALSTNDPRAVQRKTWLRFTFVSLSLLTVLQIIWLAEIYRIGKKELGF